MRKRILLISAGAVILVVVLVLAAMYWASQQSPSFYQETLRADPAEQAEASGKMLQQTTALVSDVKKEGQWEALFTEEQINGWLAVDLQKNHANAIPEGVHDPRVHIEKDELALACRYEGRNLSTVLSLAVDLYLAEPNVVALRIKRARAGLLPLPVEKVLVAITQTAQRLDLPLRWQEEDGDPVALITIPPQRTGDRKRIRVDTLTLGDGEIGLAGSTESGKPGKK